MSSSVVGLIVLLAGCAEDQDNAQDASDATTSAEAVESTEAPVVETTTSIAPEEPVSTAINETTTSSALNGSEGLEPAPGLIEFSAQLGVPDPEGLAQCMVQEAADEGFVLTESDFGPVFLAALRCETEIVSGQLFAPTFDQLDLSSIDVTAEQRSCTFDITIEWLRTVPLAESDLFAGSTPQDVVDMVVRDCGLTEEDARFIMDDA